MLIFDKARTGKTIIVETENSDTIDPVKTMKEFPLARRNDFSVYVASQGTWLRLIRETDYCTRCGKF